MLLRFDPFRELDRVADQARSARSPAIAMDAVRRDDHVEIRFDLPGFSADQLEVEVERNVLSVTAERSWERKEGEEVIVAERGHGRFTRQVLLGDNLDTEALEASYDDGVLTVRLPIRETAKSRRIERPRLIGAC